MITILRFYTDGLGQNFLTIRRWEPKFYATTTVCSQTAIWARLPGLPAEYYDPVLLKKMGEKLGTVLKIDAHTNDALRGQYACISVQVNLNQPLKTLVHISYLSQLVIYEGLNMICFTSRKLGHKSLACPAPLLNLSPNSPVESPAS